MAITELTQLFTVAEHGKGDCLRTAIACVLGLAHPAEVPLFLYHDDDTPNDEWFLDMHKWFEARGYWLDTLDLEPVRQGLVTDAERLALLDGHYVVSGISPRPYPNGDVMHHAVVCYGRDGMVVHDPHPSRAGITGLPNYAYTLSKLT